MEYTILNSKHNTYKDLENNNEIKLLKDNVLLLNIEVQNLTKIVESLIAIVQKQEQ